MHGQQAIRGNRTAADRSCTGVSALACRRDGKGREEIIPRAVVQTIAIDVNFVHLIDHGCSQGVDLIQDIGNSRITLAQQSIKRPVADKRGDIMPVGKDIDVASVRGHRLAGQRQARVPLHEKVASPDEHLDLPAHIFEGMDLNALSQFVQQLTALVSKVVRGEATRLSNGNLAVQLPDLRSQAVHLGNRLVYLRIKIPAKLGEIVCDLVELLRQCRRLVQQHRALGLPLRIVCDIAEGIEKLVQGCIDSLICGVRENAFHPRERVLLRLQPPGVLLRDVDLGLDEVVHEPAEVDDLHASAKELGTDVDAFRLLKDRFLSGEPRGIYVREVLADDLQRALIGLQPQFCYVKDGK